MSQGSSAMRVGRGCHDGHVLVTTLHGGGKMVAEAASTGRFNGSAHFSSLTTLSRYSGSRHALRSLV